MASLYGTLISLYLNTEDDADTTFVVNGQEVKAHRLIAAKRSGVLKDIINSAPANDRHLITDPMIEIEDFQEFLKYLYLEECDVYNNNIGALLHMSDNYLVPSLKEYCMERFKAECMNEGSILECAELAILYEKRCPEMLGLCFAALSQTRFESLVYASTIGPNLISAELLERIAKDCPRSECFTDEVLLRKIFEWGKMKCKQQNIAVEPKGIKMILSQIVKHIKLENVSISSLTDIIYPYQLAPSEEYVQYLVRYINGGRCKAPRGGNRHYPIPLPRRAIRIIYSDDE